LSLREPHRSLGAVLHVIERRHFEGVVTFVPSGARTLDVTAGIDLKRAVAAGLRLLFLAR